VSTSDSFCFAVCFNQHIAALTPGDWNLVGIHLGGDVVDGLLGEVKLGSIIAIEVLALVDIQPKVRSILQWQITSILVLAKRTCLDILVELLSVLVATIWTNNQTSSAQQLAALRQEVIAGIVVVDKPNEV
jgi:hypothetical protein